VFSKLSKKAIAVVISAGMVLTSVPYLTVSSAQDPSKIDQVLATLTPQQRAAYQELQTTDKSGLQLSPNVNLQDDKPISVIVEFKAKPAKVDVLEKKISGKAMSLDEAAKKVNESHEEFENDFKKIIEKDEKHKDKYRIKRKYKNAFNGASIKIPANKVESLLQSKTVKAVWSDVEVKVEPPISDGHAPSSSQSNDALKHIGVDKLHEEGLTGKGIKVGVIDTGIDYHHPDLKNAYKGGYDFVDNDSDPMETTYKNWQESGEPEKILGSTYYTEHGTHVSGIIAGQGESDSKYTVKGVAPDVDLYAYRVLGPYGGGSTASVLAGIDQAVKDKMDVINLSLGSNYNDPLFVSSIAVNHAVISGVTSVVSAGNTGKGNYSIGSPGSAAFALTVGASDLPVSVPDYQGTFHIDGEEISAQVQYFTAGYEDEGNDLQGTILPIVDVGYGRESDYSGKDVSGKIVFLSGYGTTILQRVQTAKKYGAKAVLVFYPYGSDYLGDRYLTNISYIPTFSVRGDQGKQIREKLLSGTGSFSFDQLQNQSITDGDHLANFSSRGPTRVTYDIKPEVVAPGVNIMSTVPSYVHGEEHIGKYKYAYERLSGTSMAAPFVTGIAALIQQSNPIYDAFDIKAVLMNTADTLNGNVGVFQGGAGRVDAYEAVHAGMEIQVLDETTSMHNGERITLKEETGGISFGSLIRTGNEITDQRSMKIYNYDDESKTMNVNVTFQNANNSQDAETNGVTVEVEPSITVKSNNHTELDAVLRIPGTASLGHYEGMITFVNQENEDEVYQVPFAFLLSKEGVDYTYLPESITTREDHDNNHKRRVLAGGRFRLNTPMRSLDIFLTDPATNEDIGYLGYMDGINWRENVYYEIPPFFDGYYWPLTGDSNQPVSSNIALVQPGEYKIKLVFTDDNGKPFVVEEPLYIDNDRPTIETSLPTIIEYEPGQNTYSITGTYHDETGEAMNEAGIKPPLLTRQLYWNEGDSDGMKLITKESISINVSTDTNQTVLPVEIYATDYAGVKSRSKWHYLVQKDSTYAVAHPEKEAVRSGETFKMTLSLQHVSKLKEASFSFDFEKNRLELEDIKVNPAFSEYGKVTVNHETTEDGKTKIIASLQEEGKEATGNVPMVDVFFKVQDDEFYQGDLYLKDLNATYLDASDQSVTTFGIGEAFHVIPSTAEVTGFVNGEGILSFDNWGRPITRFDFTTLGATVKAIDSNGHEYSGVISKDAVFTIPKLPPSDQPYTLVLDIPGHLTVIEDFMVGEMEEGVLIGEQSSPLFSAAAAGDVNGDKLIDIQDAIISVFSYGKENVGVNKGDINHDGKVDETDLRFIENNFLKKGPDVNENKKPKERIGKVTLEKLFRSIGLETRN
jgi:subtilisin family serine protease